MSEIHKTGKNIVAQHDDRDIHQVVGDEDRSQGTLTVIAELLDLPVIGIAVWIQVIEVGRRKAEESDLRTTGEGREHQKQSRQHHGDNHTNGWRYQMDIA